MMADKKPKLRFNDPRQVTETFVNVATSLYVAAGNLHLTLGIERPVARTSAGVELDREVVARLVMPVAVAQNIVKAIESSLSQATQAAAARRALQN
jgi:hypothetical protein